MSAVSTIDGLVDIEAAGVFTPEEAKALAEKIVAKADKAAEFEKYGVFKGALPGDLFISNGTVFVLADPTSVHYPSADVVLWRVQDSHPTYAPLTYWEGESGRYQDFAKVKPYSGTLTASTVDRRGKYIVGEGVL